MKPFFSIVTRTMPGRAALLERCQASVEAQTFKSGIEHLILRDEVGVGVAQAQRMMHTVSPRGEYVFVLDDDDYLAATDVLEKVYAELLLEANPAFAVVKVSHGQLGGMPMFWGDASDLQEGTITVSNVVVEHVQWYLHRKDFGARYAGDFDFVRSLFAAHTPAWIDVELVTVERMRNGATEMAVMA